MKEYLTLARAKDLFRYDPLTGIMTRKKDLGYKHKAGEIVGGLNDQGYLKTTVDGRAYRVHRIAHLLMTGKFPKKELDHENHVRSDNRWTNLLNASRTQNGRNQTLNNKNTSGFSGVYWAALRGKWKAQIKVDGKVLCLGTFADIEKAANARKAAEKKYGFHQNHGSMPAAA